MTTTTDEETLSDLTELGGNIGPKHYFGVITIVDDWDCALVKGSGKVPFDPQQHSQRFVALKLQLTCTKADGSTYSLDQDDITSGSKHKVTLPSLDALGIKTRPQLRTLAGQYAQIVRVPTGRTYVAAKGARAGETIQEEALKFIAIYATEAECKAAEAEFYKRDDAATGKNTPQPATVAELGGIDAVARTQLLNTLEPIWKAAKEDPAKFADILAKNPRYAQVGITVESPEVIALTGHVPF